MKRISHMDDVSMIERLARSICASRAIPADNHHPDFDTQWQAVAREAKGLLISMLEPTEGMATAGAQAGGIDEKRAGTIYRTMIDAAVARQI